jgi:secreted PhoX family phosphatase
VRGRPNFDANTASPGDVYRVRWVEIEEPDPQQDTVRAQAHDQGAAFFTRTEGAWAAGGRVYFDCTTGGEQGLGQLWEYRPREGGGELRLVYESTDAGELENPDNMVVVPATGHVFLQEDSVGDHFVRGVTRSGGIYDFARTVLNTTEFCGGTFSPDGRTFFLNQQGERLLDPGPELEAVTYAIWGPFQQAG